MNNKNLSNLIKKNTELLYNDFMTYLENNNKITEYKVKEFHMLLYNSLFNLLEEQFENFNIENRYTNEIESGKYTSREKMTYYSRLFFETVIKVMYE
jgi:hypothetical protein